MERYDIIWIRGLTLLLKRKNTVLHYALQHGEIPEYQRTVLTIRKELREDLMGIADLEVTYKKGAKHLRLVRIWL